MFTKPIINDATGEKLARISISNGHIQIHLWSKRQKQEISFELNELVTFLLQNCEQEHPDFQENNNTDK